KLKRCATNNMPQRACSIHSDVRKAQWRVIYCGRGFLTTVSPKSALQGLPLAWLGAAAAEGTAVYLDLGFSKEMRHGIEQARKEGRPVQCRSLPGWGKEEVVVDLASTTESRTGAQL